MLDVDFGVRATECAGRIERGRGGLWPADSLFQSMLGKHGIYVWKTVAAITEEGQRCTAQHNVKFPYLKKFTHFVKTVDGLTYDYESARGYVKRT